MTMQRFFYHFVICLYVSFTSSFLFSMQAPETSIFDALIPLTIESYHHIVPLKDVLKHITTYQKVSLNGIDKISGFHYYGHLNPYIEHMFDGTLIKINSRFWIFTYDDIKQFHTGYIIYQGKVYQQPKSFFPSSWTLSQVATYIQELAQEGVCQSKRAQETEHTYSLIIKPSSTDTLQIPLKVALHASLPAHILTIYPILKETKRVVLSNLETLAVQQKAAYSIAKSTAPKSTSNLLEALLTPSHSLFSVLALLEESDIHAKNEKGQTPLMLAAQAGNCDLITLLLEQEATIEVQDILGNTALHYAIDSGIYEAVLGLARQVIINKANNQGVTPLIRALQRKQYDIAELLLYLGAEVTSTDTSGYTPLIHAVTHHHLTRQETQACIPFIEALIKKGGTINAQDNDGSTALMHAIAHHNTILAKYLLQNQADYRTVKNQREETAYTLAVNTHFQEIISLIDQKENERKMVAERKEQQKKQRESLQAIKSEIIKDMLSSSSLKLLPSIDQELLNKMFLFAVKENKGKVIEQLLVKLKDFLKPETYHEALSLTFTHNVSIFSTLIQHMSLKKELAEEWFLKLLEAHYKEQKCNYSTLLAFLSTNHPSVLTKALQAQDYHNYLLKFVEQRIVPFSHTQAGEFLLEAVRHNAGSLIEKLLAVYPSVLPYKNGKGQNALMIAAQADHPSLITALYRKGLQLHEQDNSGKTAINYAPAGSSALKEIQTLCTQEEREEQEKQKVRLLQERKSKIEELQRQGYSSLMIAAYYNDVDTIERDKITNINSTTSKGITAVMVAIERNNREALDALFAKPGLLINAQDKTGMTALMYAVKNNNASLVEKLFAQGASAFIRNQTGKQVFTLTKSISSSVQKLLETYGAQELMAHLAPVFDATEEAIVVMLDEIDKKVHFNQLSCKLKAHIASLLIQKNDSKVLKYFLRKAALTIDDLIHNMPFNPLVYAADRLDRAMLSVFLTHAVHNGKEGPVITMNRYLDQLFFTIPAYFSNIVAFCRQGIEEAHLQRHRPHTTFDMALKLHDFLPLIVHFYLESKFEDMKKLITIIKPKVDTIIVGYNNGTSLLLHAILQGVDNNLITFLLNYTENINHTDNKGNTPLLAACLQNKPNAELVQLLIDHKADVNAYSTEGASPLMAAIRKGHYDIAKMLIKAGASVNKKEYISTAPLPLACESGNIDMVKLLLEHNIDVNQAPQRGDSALIKVCATKDAQIARLLIAHNADVNKQNSTGLTALAIASNKGSLTLVKMLLDAGADPNIQNHYGETALAAAITHIRPETVNIIKLLLEHGANPNKEGTLGHTPLFAAVRNNCAQAAQLLLNAKADVNHQDKEGSTALLEACNMGHKELVKVLLEHNADVNTVSYVQRISPLIAACSPGGSFVQPNEQSQAGNYSITEPLKESASTKQNKKEIIEMLLAVPGINVAYEMRPGSGYNALKLAQMWSNKDAVKLIKAYMSKAQQQKK